MDQVTAQALTLYARLTAGRSNGKTLTSVPSASTLSRVAPVANREE